MTNHTTFSPHGSARETIVSFPIAGATSRPDVPAAIDGHEAEGIPAGFSLLDDGICEFRPSDAEDLVPLKVCSPVVV